MSVALDDDNQRSSRGAKCLISRITYFIFVPLASRSIQNEWRDLSFANDIITLSHCHIAT